LDFLVEEFGGIEMEGGVCFPDNNMTELFSASCHSKKIKGGGGLQAICSFWFSGKTGIRDIDVNYLFEEFGTFTNAIDWPGTSDLIMTEWELSVETTTGGGRKIACTSSGEFGTDDVIRVVEIPAP